MNNLIEENLSFMTKSDSGLMDFRLPQVLNENINQE
jgi:hypothetical protein